MKKFINSFLILLFFVSGSAQSKVDTADVIITAADQFFYWKGYNSNTNDTTKLIKLSITVFNSVADSILSAKQREDKVVYSNDIIRHYKSNFFSLITLTKLLDSSKLVDTQKLQRAFSSYIDKDNSFSLLEWYANDLANKSKFLSGLYELNKERSAGAGWNTADQNSIERMEKTLSFIGMASGKSVKIICGNGGQVFHNGVFRGGPGVVLILFKGNHLIEIRENNVVKCRHSLIIPETDSGVPVTLNCNYPTSPCSCR